MGDHLLNPRAAANAEPQKLVRAMSLGDDYAVIGLSLEPMLSDDGHLCAVLTVVGGRESKFVPTIPVKLVLGELCRIPIADLKAKLAAAIDGPKETQ